MPSSVVRHLDYEAQAGTLRVVFQSGRVYVYHGVATATFADMKAARSKGAYFNRYIRDHYDFDRLSDQTSSGHMSALEKNN